MAVKSCINDSLTFLRPLVDSLAAAGMPPGVTDIYRGRNRVVKFHFPPAGLLNIKEFRIPCPINRLVYGHLRHSKARRAYDHARRLLALGFSTPEPLAWLECYDSSLMGRSYFISRQIDGLRDIRELADEPRRDDIIDGVARLMARLHAAGVWMKDFSQGNILWRETLDGDIEFFLVDINRMAFNVKSRRRLLSNFRTVADDPAVLRALAAAYAFHAGVDPDSTLSAAFNAHRSALRRRALKTRLRRR